MESLNKMLNFDKQRAQFFEDSATEIWNTLQKLKKADELMDHGLQNDIDLVESTILKKQMLLHRENVDTNDKISAIQSKDERIMKELSQMALMDKKRMATEKTTEEDALSKDGLSYGQELHKAVNQEKKERKNMKKLSLPSDNILVQKKKGKKAKRHAGKGKKKMMAARRLVV